MGKVYIYVYIVNYWFVMFQAIAALHEENATYPKKITYAYTAHTSPRLAVEALEASSCLYWWCKLTWTCRYTASVQTHVPMLEIFQSNKGDIQFIFSIYNIHAEYEHQR